MWVETAVAAFVAVSATVGVDDAVATTIGLFVALASGEAVPVETGVELSGEDSPTVSPG